MAEGIARPLGAEGGDQGANARSPLDILRAGRDQAFDEAKAAVVDVAETQRRRAVETIGGLAQALHKTAKEIDPENEIMARYTEIAADRLDSAARYLRQTRLGDFVEGAEDFARRQPWWFIGGAAAAGFVAARVFKSSEDGMGRRAMSDAPVPAASPYAAISGVPEVGEVS